MWCDPLKGVLEFHLLIFWTDAAAAEQALFYGQILLIGLNWISRSTGNVSQ